MIKGLRTVIYPAPNLTEAKDWYSKVLGTNPILTNRFMLASPLAVLSLDSSLMPHQVRMAQGPFGGLTMQRRRSRR